MKYFIVSAFILGISLGLTGCGDGDNNRPSEGGGPNGGEVALLAFEDIANLDECTKPQRDTLETTYINGNDPNQVTTGLCVNTSDETKTAEAVKAEFETLRNAAVNGNRDVCKWTYRTQIWFCSPGKTD